MLVLLDNNVSRHFSQLLPGHEVMHVQQLGWQDLKNGLLLTAAEDAGYEVLITADKQMRHKQNLRDRKICLIVLNSLRIVIDEIAPLAPQVLEILRDLPEVSLIIVNPPFAL